MSYDGHSHWGSKKTSPKLDPPPKKRGFLTSLTAVVPLDAEDLGMCHGIEGEICVLFIVTLCC